MKKREKQIKNKIENKLLIDRIFIYNNLSNIKLKYKINLLSKTINRKYDNKFYRSFSKIPKKDR